MLNYLFGSPSHEGLRTYLDHLALACETIMAWSFSFLRPGRNRNSVLARIERHMGGKCRHTHIISHAIHLGPGPKDVHIAVAPPCPFCVTTIPPTDSYFAVTLSPDGKHVAATTLGIVHARAYNENARELFSRRHTISPVLRRLAQGVPAQSFDAVRRSEGHLKES